MPSNTPTRETIKLLLEHHLGEHRRLPESARTRDLGAEQALVQDYSGRVVYELLQNALDRSRDRILIQWDPEARCLEVANDGQPVSAYAGQSPRRSDFHALLSLHSSTKSAKESVGNKGVGFRSVFAAAPEVEVWSRTAEGSWWGLRMCHPSQLQPVPDVEWMNLDVASFYAPQWLEDTTSDRLADYQTVVRLVDVRPERAHVLEQTVRDLMQVPMRFLEDRAPKPEGLSIRLVLGENTLEHRLVESAQEIAVSEPVMLPVSDTVQRDTGLDLDRAEVRVMACSVFEDPTTQENERRHQGLYWSYLPTEQEAGFGVDIHADFYLSNSRRSLALRALADGEEDTASDPAGWNRRLVRRAAHLIVHDLWQRPDLFRRDDFWEFAHPESCHCEHLTFEVGRLLLRDLSVLEDLIRRSFREKGSWTLQRYTDFFSALDGWATYAYRHPSCAGPLKLGLWREALLEVIERSGAPVLPIVQEANDKAMAQPDAVARPMVRGKKGQKRGDADRIYLRQGGGGTDTIESLPPVVQKQGTYITVFEPPRMGGDYTQYGLLEFSRPELLAQLQPGGDAQEHRDLLRAALRLASHEPTQGGAESVLARASGAPGGPAWRLSLESGTTLRRAAQNLRSLYLPTLTGWEPADRVARGDGGPWPRLDESELASVISELTHDTEGANRSLLDVDRACHLFGIGVLPIDRHGRIPDWPTAPSEALGRSILKHWSRDLHPVFTADLGAQALSQLRSTPWIHDTATEDPSVVLEAGIGEGAPYAPLDLWMQSQSGFRTRLLPRLTVLRESMLPVWLQDLGIENPTQTDSEERILRALARLRSSPDAMKDERDLSDLYRRMVEGVFKLDRPPQIPLLYRYVDENGGTRSLEWGQPENDIWHDPGGAESSALSAFRNVRVWAFRGTKRAKAEALGLVHFSPGPPQVEWQGESDHALAGRLRERIWEALPDLLAAASMAREELDEEMTIRQQAMLQVQHFERVWVRWQFAGKVAERGRDDLGDVFLLPLADGSKALCFDGHEPPLVECAFPLSEWLCGNRAFGTIFRDGLYAWSRAESERQRASSLARFRRDHNISDADIGQWRGRLHEARLDGDRKALWQARVLNVLEQFGGVDEALWPGMTVTPALWKPAAQGVDTNAPNIDEETLRNRMESALVDDPQFRLLTPLVDFRTTNRDRFLRESRVLYIASAADRFGRDEWTEALLEELTEQGSGVTDDDNFGFLHLRFNVDRALRGRYALPGDGDLAPTREALAFANGQIPVSSLPEAGAALNLRPFGAKAGTGTPRAAITEEAWLTKARRKASGGYRAEDAILSLALRHAAEWRLRDQEGFRRAIETVLPVLGAAGAERHSRIEDDGGLRDFLHVSDYLGDTGFDVLVPNEHAGLLLLVEVKRVPSLKADAPFFLSENERRRALAYLEQNLPWRLWLVASNGEIADASSITEHFQAHQDDVQTLLNAGLRPGEWMLVFQTPFPPD